MDSSSMECVRAAAGTRTAKKLERPHDTSACWRIIEELNQTYEDRLQDIDKKARGALQLKVTVYKEWVELLQNLMWDSIETLKDLEYEATSRLKLLEQKLDLDCEKAYRGEITNLRSDVHNFVKLIKNHLEKQKWDSDGLEFKSVDIKKILEDLKAADSKVALRGGQDMKEDLKCRNCTKVDKEIAELICDNIPDEEFQYHIRNLKSYIKEYEGRLAEANERNMLLEMKLEEEKRKNADKEKALTNMKALTFEVAEKYDQIRDIKGQVMTLEEELKQAEMKIQFKDNVIKELRRDCKNTVKSPYLKNEKPWLIARSSSLESNQQIQDIQNSSDLSNMTCPTDSSLMSLATDKFHLRFSEYLGTKKVGNVNITCSFDRKVQCKEDEYIKILQGELLELFEIQRMHDNLAEEEKNEINNQQTKIFDLVQDLIKTFSKSRNKLAYITNQLRCMCSSNESETHDDSGYSSQENMEPEHSIVCAVQHRVNCLKQENEQLKLKIQQLQADIQSANNSITSNVKMLKHVASEASSAFCKEVSRENSSSNDRSRDSPLCEAIITLEKELCEKDIQLKVLKKAICDIKGNLECCKSENCIMQKELDVKDKTICELKKNLECFKRETSMLQKELHCNDDLNELHSKDSKIFELEDHIESLKKDVCRLKKEVTCKNNVICELQKNIDCLKKNIFQWQKESEAKDHTICDLQKEIEGYKQDNCAWQNEFELKNQTICELKKEIERYKQDIGAWQEEVESKEHMICDIEKEIECYKRDNSTWQEELNCKDKTICELQKKLECFKKEHSTICELKENIESFDKENIELQQELQCKDSTISELQKHLESFKRDNCVLQQELSAKDNTICELHQTMACYQSNPVENNELQGDNKMFCAIKNREISDCCSKFLEEKHKLEIECQNQHATIQNLRHALEACKRNSQIGNTPSSQLELENEILSQELSESFTEMIRLEKYAMKIRDENLWLKECLIDFEADYQCLQQKYVTVKTLEKEKPHLSTEQNYRDIFDELTSELASLSNQVTIAQEEFEQDEYNTATLEASFRELESQNDLLQKTIETLEERLTNYDNSLSAYEKEVQQLNDENASLQETIQKVEIKNDEISNKYQAVFQMLHQQKARCRCGAAQSLRLDDNESISTLSKRPKDLQHIFEMLDRKNEELRAIKERSAEENTRLSKSIEETQEQMKDMRLNICLLERTIEKKDEELKEATCKILELSQHESETQLKNIIEELSQELLEAKAIRRDRETSMTNDLAALRKNLEEQTRALCKANETIVSMEKQTNHYRRQGDSANKENALLKAEIFTLKENLASQEGIERSLREQMRTTQEELCKTKADVERFAALSEDVETFRRHCNRLKDSNYELVRKYNNLVEDYNKLEEEYRKLLDIKEQMVRECEASRSWQNEQSKQDKLIEDKICKLEDHIGTLLEDRQILIDKIKQLHRDNVLVGGELEQYKDVLTDSLSEIQTRTSLTQDLDSRTDHMDLVIRKIRRTVRKLSQTRSIWQDGVRRFSD